MCYMCGISSLSSTQFKSFYSAIREYTYMNKKIVICLILRSRVYRAFMPPKYKEVKKELLEIEVFHFVGISYLVGLDKIIFSYMSTFTYFSNFLFDGKSFFTLNKLLTNDIQLTVS